MRRYFYLDTENIQTYNFTTNWNISKDDTVIVFVSNNSKNIKFEDLKFFTNTDATFVYENVATGEKNAMDNQMIVEASIRAIRDNSMHYIVSDDCGFRVAIDYLNAKLDNRRVYLIRPSLDDEIWKLMFKHDKVGYVHNDIVAKYGDSVKKQIYYTYRDVFEAVKKPQNENNEIIDIIIKSKDLNCYRNNLRKKFGDKKGNEMYWNTKSLYLEQNKEVENDNI